MTTEAARRVEGNLLNLFQTLGIEQATSQPVDLRCSPTGMDWRPFTPSGWRR